MYNRVPFEFHVEAELFEKSGAPEGHHRRIGGVISTETKDQEGEILLQKGLDFSKFLKNGWFNNNHGKKPEDVVGYPESVEYFKKGSSLPNGTIAKSNCHWAEGYLLKGHEAADTLWKLGKSLKKTSRSLGFSVEGAVKRRAGALKKIVAEAIVKNVAITHCAVNDESGLAILAKSLEIMESEDFKTIEDRVEALEKALTMGDATPGVAPVGPKTGEGAGQVLATESLETGKPKSKKKKKKDLEKALTDLEAVSWFQAKKPNATIAQALQFIKLTRTLKRQGRI